MSSRRPVTKASIASPAEDGSSGQSKSVVLGPKDRLVGKLFVEGDLRIGGTVDGALEATGDVEIDGGGQVKGPVTTRRKLTVGSSGSLLGDVRVARLEIQDGATFSGNVSMGKQVVEEASAPVPAPEPEALAPVPEPQPPAPPAKGKRR